MNKRGGMMFFLFLIFLVLTFFIPTASAYEKEITNCQELQDIKYDLKGNYYLANDIDCSETKSWNDGRGFEPIGNSEEAFRGSFDGRGYKISGLYINRGNLWDVGLLGSVGWGGNIKNVKLIDVNITGYGDVGGLIGSNIHGNVRNCSSEGRVSGEISVGGLVGTNNNANISNSYSVVKISEGDYIGGLVGDNYYGRIINSYSKVEFFSKYGFILGGLAGDNTGEILGCYAEAKISGDELIGGLVGMNENGTISNCYSKGNVYYSEGCIFCEKLGGLVGENNGTIINSYSIVDVPDEINTGGLVGKNDENGTCKNSFWDKEISGQEFSDCGKGKTSEEMKKDSTFTYVGWDFKNIWNRDDLTNGGYPYLRNIGREVKFIGIIGEEGEEKEG